MSKIVDIGLAQQQLVGWKHGRDGYSLTSLISAMNLTKDEWEYLKARFILPLNPIEMMEIEKYFKK